MYGQVKAFNLIKSFKVYTGPINSKLKPLVAVSLRMNVGKQMAHILLSVTDH